MAKYEVTKKFKDKIDRKTYEVGETYPKPANKKVEIDRLQFLEDLGFIKTVKEKVKPDTKEV